MERRKPHLGLLGRLTAFDLRPHLASGRLTLPYHAPDAHAMDDDEGGPAAAVNPQLIGARSAQDSLRSYELSTGFHCSRNGRTPAVKPPLNHLSSTESTPIDLAELHETWAGWVEGLLGGVLKEPPARAEGGERQGEPARPSSPCTRRDPSAHSAPRDSSPWHGRLWTQLAVAAMHAQHGHHRSHLGLWPLL